jgi:hypothetical protein
MIDRILWWAEDHILALGVAALIVAGFILYSADVVPSCSALERQFYDDVTRATRMGNELDSRRRRGLTVLDRMTLDTGIALGERIEAEVDQLLNRGCDRQKLEASVTAYRSNVLEADLSLMRRNRDDLH